MQSGKDLGTDNHGCGPRFWRMPTAFGPMPGPRQDSSGQTFEAQLQRTMTTKATITIRTNAEYLKRLLPSESYSLTSIDNLGTASFSVESFKDLAWLGGGGYDLLAL